MPGTHRVMATLLLMVGRLDHGVATLATVEAVAVEAGMVEEVVIKNHRLMKNTVFLQFMLKVVMK